MTVRPSLLFLAQSLPYPPHSGVQSRTYNVLRQLQREFDVTLLPFARRNHHADANARASAGGALAQMLSQVGEPVPIPAEFSRLRQLRDHALSTITRRPYTFYQYQARSFAQQLRRLLSANTFDLVHLDSLDLVQFADQVSGVPVVCTHHDVESVLLERKATQIRFPPLRQYLRYQAALTRRVERDFAPRFALNLMMSDRDTETLHEIAPGSRTFVVANGVDTDFFAPGDEDSSLPTRAVFMGPTFMFANRDAVEFFLSEIWPLVRTRCPDATLELVGRNPPQDKARYTQIAGVIPSGYVEDVRPHLQKGACSVVPIRVGGGTRIKILESWAMGLPVISTTVGCEGLDAVDEQNILIRDTPEEFAAAVVRVFEDPELRRRLSHEGRRTAQRLYSWDRIGEGLRENYWNLIETPHQRSSVVSDRGQGG